MRILLISLSAFTVCSVFGLQNSNELSALDTLYQKKYITQKNGRACLVSYKPETPDGYCEVHFDTHNRIRRYVENYEYPDYKNYVMVNYNEKGEAIAIYFKIFNPEGYSCQGSIVRNKTNPDLTLCNYEIEDMATYKTQRITGEVKNLPAVIGDFWVETYLSVQSLLKKLELQL